MRREKRDQRSMRFEEEQAARELAGQTLKVTEFVTASELASMMSVPVTDIIKACFALGMMVSINQRLDAEVIELVASDGARCRSRRRLRTLNSLPLSGRVAPRR